MMFIALTLSITLAIMISTVTLSYLIMQPKVMNWYMNTVMKQMEKWTVFDEKDEL